MITRSYDLDIVEEAFDVTLKIDLTLKILVNAKTWCYKYERYGHYDYQCLSESQHVKTAPSDDVSNSKMIEDVHVSFKIASTIKNISVGSDTLIIESYFL